MTQRTKWVISVATSMVFCMLFSWTQVFAAGLLTPKDGSLPALAIHDHMVKVVVEDGYAITSVEQVFHNPHDRDLEAIYSCPVPEHAAVAEFSMWIDGKPVTGEVFEKKEARRIYEEEKAAGRDAGLTEKDHYKTFDISVSPVRAGQDTRMRLVYLQPAHVDTGIGSYVYPLEDGGVDEEKLAFWTANDEVTGHFSFDMRIRSSYPVDAVRLPNHPGAQINRDTNGDWVIQLSNQAATVATDSMAQNPDLIPPPLPDTPSSGSIDEHNELSTVGNRGHASYRLDQDVVIYWRHQQGLPGSVEMVAHKGAGSDRGTFMLTLTPGDDLQPITEGRDWIFVLDISGSMQGKYATLTDGVQRALKKMRPDDRFRIVLFNDEAHELTSGFVTANAQNVATWSNKVAQVNPSSSTNLFAGLEMGLRGLDADRTGAIVLVTDGVANVGETAQRKFIQLLEKKDIRLFTFIMGNSANLPLLEAITKASNGFALSISNADDIVGKLLLAMDKVSHEALHGVKLDIEGIKVADLTPRTIGSLYRGQQLVIFGHYWKGGDATVRLSGKVAGEAKTYQTQFNFPPVSALNPEVERLWAYASIEDMQAEIEDFGEAADLKQGITDVALEYSLVTDYTSMLVMSEEQFTQRGVQRRNRARRELETKAQAQRAVQPAKSTRVDSSKPMFTSPRSSFGGGGGGALDLWYGLLLAPLAALRLTGQSKNRNRS
ncbi:MAG: VIT and VWA domain-containing protein [Pedobacter sp.]